MSLSACVSVFSASLALALGKQAPHKRLSMHGKRHINTERRGLRALGLNHDHLHFKNETNTKGKSAVVCFVFQEIWNADRISLIIKVFHELYRIICRAHMK